VANKPWHPNYLAFRSTLKALRKSKGLKQEQLGSKLGKHQSYISKYENGERQLNFLELLDILEAFNYSLSEFHSEYLAKVAETPASYSYKKRSKKTKTQK